MPALRTRKSSLEWTKRNCLAALCTLVKLDKTHFQPVLKADLCANLARSIWRKEAWTLPRSVFSIASFDPASASLLHARTTWAEKLMKRQGWEIKNYLTSIGQLKPGSLAKQECVQSANQHHCLHQWSRLPGQWGLAHGPPSRNNLVSRDICNVWFQEPAMLCFQSQISVGRLLRQ